MDKDGENNLEELSTGWRIYVGDTISGIGAIGEMVSYIWDDNRDFNNAMMRVGMLLEKVLVKQLLSIEQILTKLLIWETLDGGLQCSPSMVSNVSAMIPGYGVVKGIGMIGKAARLAKFGKD